MLFISLTYVEEHAWNFLSGGCPCIFVDGHLFIDDCSIMCLFFFGQPLWTSLELVYFIAHHQVWPKAAPCSG